MTTYLGEKAVGIGTIKATKAVAGDVQHDGTLVGNGNTEPLGVNKQVIATTNQVANLVSNIESKIPESASETNQLITKADLKDIGLDGYVKKSGDTMTGDLGIVSDTYKTSANISVEGARGRTTIRVSDSEEPGVYSQFELNRSGTFVARTISGTSINYGKVGAPDVPMYNVYTKRLNNGADLIVPSEGGTLARVEDLTDLQDALDAKQDTLTAGDGISIEGGVISNTRTNAEWGNITGDINNQTDLQDALGAAISVHNTATSAHSNIRGVAGGLATLDNNAKVPMSQINDALIGNVSYQGLWNATENVPFLADPSGDLPLGYTQLKAIKGFGGAYIDTGVVFTGQKIKYVMDWSGGSGTYEKLYGACTTLENYTSSDSTGCIFFGGNRNEVRVNVGKIQVTHGIMASGKMSTELIVDSQAKFYEFIINDNRYTGTFTGDVNRELPIHLCRQNYQTANASAPKPFEGNVYSFSLEMDGVIVRNMLPARRDSDGIVGMYDTVNDVFYGPADGGAFVAVEGDIQLPKGDYYITSVAGDRFGLHFDVGDWVISTGEGWTKVDNTDAVVAVNGRTGNVVLGANDVGAYTKEEVDALVGSGGGSMPTRYVESINGFTGNVFLGCREIGTYTSVEIDAMIGDIASVLDSINGEGA